MQYGPKLTVLVGHDTNIANLGGFLDLHWTLPDYPRDDPPPGGALGFEVLADPAGKQYVRAFYRAQTMDQVRELQALDGDNKPAYVYLEIPGCAEPCAFNPKKPSLRKSASTIDQSAATKAAMSRSTSMAHNACRSASDSGKGLVLGSIKFSCDPGIVIM